MLKRIAVITKDKECITRADALIKKQPDTQLIVGKRGSSIMPGTMAIVADTDSFSGAVNQALALAAQSEEMLYLLADALDCRESLDPGTSRRVTDYAIRFGRALGLDDNDEFTLARAMLLRDLGKIQVANEVLLKDGLLSYDEWSLIHTHPHLGAEIAAGTESLKDIAEILQNHHECYDGTGYPNGIEGEAIPYLARVAKIVDVYCAMTSQRAYRKGQSTHEEAIEFILSERGKHFDPGLVDAFVNAVHAK